MMRTALISILLMGASLAALPAQALCREDRVELRGDWGTARFRVEIADDRRERATGLMHVEEMARLAGMLFIYERPQMVSFWMENTLIPLDLIFMDQTGLVVNVHSDAIPMDRTPIPGGSAEVVYVLEVNGGVAEDFGINEGSQMRHPTVEQDAALWPCEP